jgi:3',5'-cyclic AMP phosphodiesterase CpdA
VRARVIAALVAALALWSCTTDQPERARRRLPISVSPLPEGGVRFVVIGDFGTGGGPQRAVAASMCDFHDQAPFDFVVTTGDNVYPTGNPGDFGDHFKDPYECLAERGVRWHTVLGNHDVLTAGGVFEIRDPAFGMPDRYYSWQLGPVQFTMLDSNNLDAVQLEWMRAQLERAHAAPWSVVVFHHAVFSGGARYGSNPSLNGLLGETFAQSGVDLVLNGHEHLYSRAEDLGVDYLVSGGGGANVYPCAQEVPPVVSVCEGTHHFVAIEATPEALTVTPITPDGAIERARIDPNP